MLDLPGIIQGAKDGKGRGRQVIAVAKTCHLIFIVLDVNKPLTDKKVIEAEDTEASCEPLRQYGRPKDGGYSVQVVVALAVTRESLPVRSWVCPGNTTNVATVTKVKRDLKGWKLGRALFLGNAGFNSADNRHRLAKACGSYLLATRLNSAHEVNHEVMFVLSCRLAYCGFS